MIGAYLKCLIIVLPAYNLLTLKELHLQSSKTLAPPTIRITGYGVDFNDPTRNQTQQTSNGPNAGSAVTTMRYQVDTEGGSSGSPVIDDATGEAVGVHTNGGCNQAGGGSNSGTSTFNTAFWNALNPTISITVVPDPPLK